MEHRELIRRWLREKGYHINDIASALEFYDAGNPKPTDAQIREVAETSHLEAINLATKKITGDKPVLIKYVKMDSIPKASFFAFIGMLAGLLIGFTIKEMGLVKWLVLEMTQ